MKARGGLRVAAAAALFCAGCSALLGLDDLTDLPANPPVTEAGVEGGDAAPTKVTKVDVLLVVDDSSSMGDKSKVLASTLDPLLREVAAAGDVHLGVITSSLGGVGECVRGSAYSKAHLVHTAPDGTPLPSKADGFITFAAGTTNLDGFVADAKTIVTSVGQQGCGLEAPLESAYRFLVQPDPWDALVVAAPSTSPYVGIDRTILSERRAFLRPDSLVVVVMITDEDDTSLDPQSINGQGAVFAAKLFPGSTTARPNNGGTTAPRPTKACATDPASPDCTSCGFGVTCDAAAPSCAKIKNDPGCAGDGGLYYGPTEDDMNVRFHKMKQRFGLDPQYPVQRYVAGFTEATIPDRASEHLRDLGGGGAELTSEYSGIPRCTNPLFAERLPASDSEELCALPRGPRTKERVVFALIAGAPQALLDTTPPAWPQLLGADPEKYDAASQDPHMDPSTTPRPNLQGPSAQRGDNGTDPYHGREYTTDGRDLQYACTFALDAPRTCTIDDPSCDCADPSKNPPVCGATLGEQSRAKAYPSLRPLRVAKGLGERAIVGSICPPPRSNYAETMTRLANLLRPQIR